MCEINKIIVFIAIVLFPFIFADEGAVKSESKSISSSPFDIQIQRNYTAGLVVSNIFDGIKSAQGVGLSLDLQKQLAYKLASSLSTQDLNNLKTISSNRNLK